MPVPASGMLQSGHQPTAVCLPQQVVFAGCTCRLGAARPRVVQWGRVFCGQAGVDALNQCCVAVATLHAAPILSMVGQQPLGLQGPAGSCSRVSEVLLSCGACMVDQA
jgi:hypothetical protein